MASHYNAAALIGRVRKLKDYSEDSVIPSIHRYPFAKLGSLNPYSG